MPLLIDGHNLIGRLPEISMQDPDKEARLVMLLRRYCARAGRKGAVVFDRGLPGGVSQWSTHTLQVVFASAHTDADAVLINRIRKSRNPRGLIVVSSDREIMAAARRQGATVRRAEEFAQEIAATLAKTPAADSDDRLLSPEEVAEWEALFQRGDTESHG